MSFWKLMKVVSHKELLDGFRDRRALMSALAVSFVGTLDDYGDVVSHLF